MSGKSEHAKFLRVYVDNLPFERKYLKPKEYSVLWGLSESTVMELISEGKIAEKSGALAKGTGGLGKHKRIHRLFNPYSLSYECPPLPLNQNDGSPVELLEATIKLLSVEKWYLKNREYAKLWSSNLSRIKERLSKNVFTIANGALAKGTDGEKVYARLFAFFHPDKLCVTSCNER